MKLLAPISALLLAVTFLLPAMPPVYACDEHAPDKASIANVVDGDTLTILVNGVKDKVRLIGVDTPESHLNKRAHLQAGRSSKDVQAILNLGKQAGQKMRSLAPKGMAVRLEYDVQKRDKYGRLLAYAYTPEGIMLNEEILREGYANLLTMPPNVKYVERFSRALREGREANRGLWASGGFKN